MKTRLLRCRRRDIARLLLASFVAGHSLAATFSEWQQRQPIEVPAPGLVKIALSPATLDALRPSLEDLRLADSTGNEVPFLIERPAPEPAPVRVARSFKPVLRGAATVLDIETGTDVPINAVTLETPEREFIKAVRIEGSRMDNALRRLPRAFRFSARVARANSRCVFQPAFGPGSASRWTTNDRLRRHSRERVSTRPTPWLHRPSRLL